MDETRDEQGQQQSPAPGAAIYEFGTWRQMQATTVRRTTTQGRPIKKKGG